MNGSVLRINFAREMSNIDIYTDGSCNNEYKTGAWASVILIDSEEILLTGLEYDTTHQRMELFAVIASFEYIIKNNLRFTRIKVFTDSQYVAEIQRRIDKFISSEFKTKSGNDIRNIDLVKKLIENINHFHPEFIKVKAHQKRSSERNINREVDKVSRKLVREEIRKIKSQSK